jgi:hypothetical protein
MDIIGNYEMILPVNDFLVGFVGRFRAEGWVADKALEHDRAERPPVTLISIPLLQEDLRCNVVWRSDR